MIMNFFTTNIWLIFILGNFLSMLIVKHHSKKYIAKNPALESGYHTMIKNWLIYGNIPWLIIGIGQLSGITKHFFEYFQPRALNPMVLIFHAAIILLWGWAVYWIYFKNGAKFLEQHPTGTMKLSAVQIKFLFPIMLLGGIIAMVMMWTVELPISKF